MRRSGKNYTMPAACILLIAAVIFGKISEDPSRNASEIFSENAGESVSMAETAGVSKSETAAGADTTALSLTDEGGAAAQSVGTEFTLSDIPAWDGETYYALVNGNEPYFTEAELDGATKDFIELSDLDQLGRRGVATAVLSSAMRPTEERGSIGEIKPSGWHSVKYEWVDGYSLYNRCHLIAYALSGLNAEERNLITGTRSMNTEGMQPFVLETMDYVDSNPSKQVLYRVTPIFEDDDLVASGVLMEAEAPEDPEGLSFCVYCYNEEPGVTINHLTGDSAADDGSPQYGYGDTESEKSQQTVPSGFAESDASQSGTISGASTEFVPESGTTYVLNTNTMRFHRPSCESVQEMQPENREETTKTRQELIDEGYKPCGSCKP